MSSRESEHPRSRKFSRRSFLKLSAAAAVGSAVVGTLGVHELQEIHAHWLKDLKRKTIIPTRAEVAGKLREPLVNYPYLYKHPEYWEECIVDMKLMGVKRVRLLLDDAFEKKIGQYDDQILWKIHGLCVYLAKNGISAELDLIDCYGMTVRQNVIYGANKADSPYSHDDYQRFFEDPRIQENLERRYIHILSFFQRRETPALVAFTPANEPEPPNDPSVLDDWVARQAGIIRSVAGQETLILGGVSKPWLLTERSKVSANTIHWYYLLESDEYRKYIQTDRVLATIGQEIGFSNGFGGVQVLTAVQSDLFSALCLQIAFDAMTTQTKKTVNAHGLTTLAIWELASSRNATGMYSFAAKKRPITVESLDAVHEITQGQFILPVRQ
ncbi:MAG TPA: twin-arginine translocation signal domain-containing protein [Patescibacteria group bacterium]|nr:twin-arginine translocation signal domain-containing protein [Patescibacteria group bacterium]